MRAYEKNARKHTPEHVDRIAKSIREFGFLSCVLVDKKKQIIAGHGRVFAAIKLGIEAVPCIFAEELTETQARAYRLADNKISDASEWDEAALKSELDELSQIADLSALGFESSDLDALGLGELPEIAEEKKEKQPVICPRCGGKVS